MKPLKLYKIVPVGLPVMHFAARSEHQACEMFVTWQAVHEHPGRSFTVELVALDDLDRVQRSQLEARLAASSEGIARHNGTGWAIDSEGWSSFDDVETQLAGLKIFHMRNLEDREAFVLAEDYDRASALFKQHLRARGGDPDAILNRELELQQIEDEASNDAVYEALDFDCEGLVACDADGHWVFVVPLGAGVVYEGDTGT